MAKLWVKLKSFNATKVSTKDCTNVDDFIKACKKELLFLHGDFPPGAPSLSTTEGGPALRVGLPLSAISSQPGYVENDDEHPLFITIQETSVAGSIAASNRSSQSSLNPPHPTRKRRWDQLNKVLCRSRKRSTVDSTGYSYVSWPLVKDILETTPYIQSSKTIPQAEFNLLCKYLEMAVSCFGSLTEGKEALRLHLIAPILVCVGYLFKGDIQIDVEADLGGVVVEAHGHFEFVLRRKKKMVCIVQAKRDDMQQGMTQALIGCEVAAEVDQLNTVYGIVTNYVEWIFLRSLDERIDMEEFSMENTTNGPLVTSLMKVASKIYAMLSDE